MLNLRTSVVKEFYARRKALAKNVFLTIDRNHETIEDFEKLMMTRIGKDPSEHENHITFGIKTKNGTMIYITCSDNKYYIGTEVKVENW